MNSVLFIGPVFPHGRSFPTGVGEGVRDLVSDQPEFDAPVGFAAFLRLIIGNRVCFAIADGAE